MLNGGFKCHAGSIEKDPSPLSTHRQLHVNVFNEENICIVHIWMHVCALGMYAWMGSACMCTLARVLEFIMFTYAM